MARKLKPRELLAHWKDLAGDESGRPWTTAEDASGFFQRFRPRGKGAERAFEGLAYAEDLSARLMRVFEATAPGYRRSDMYFEVRRPPVISKATLRRLGDELLNKLKEMARVEKELVSALRPVKVMVASTSKRKGGHDDDDVDDNDLVTDIFANFMLACEPCEPAADVMEEALYSMTCQYDVCDYVRWPLYQDSTKVIDPFLPAFELWRHRVDWRLSDAGVLMLTPSK